MLITNRLIDALEYSSAAIKTKNNVKAKPYNNPRKILRINLVRLASAIAKTMHSNPIGRLEFLFAVFEQISALQRHTASFSKNPSNLRLRDDYFMKNRGLRDFSKSTLEGQYAQGISFLFFQDLLGVPALLDFDKYCRDEKIPELGGQSSRPDFIGCKKPNEYWIVESKANLESTSIKQELREGLEQCDDGKTHLTANGQATPTCSYCSLVSFRLENSSEDTTIHYADPKNEPNGREFNSLKFLRSYYENALLSLGYEGNPQDIWSSDNAELFKSEFEYLGRNFYYLRAYRPTQPLFLASPGPRSYNAGISVDIIRALKSGDLEDYFNLVNIFHKHVSDINEKVQENQEWVEDELFVDGTLINTSW